MATEQMFCTSCGAAFPAGARFCGSCGSATDTQPTSASDADASDQEGTIGSGLWDGLTGKARDRASPPPEPNGSVPPSGEISKKASPYARMSAGVWTLAIILALVMFKLGMFDEPLGWMTSKIPVSPTFRSSVKLAVVKERFPPTEYPPRPASFVLEIKSSEDQTVTVTNIVVNNRPECVGLVFAKLPQTLRTGDAIKVVPQCDPIKVVVSTDRGDQVYTWDN